MALDDLGDKVKEETKEEKAEEKVEKLGIDDPEELEKLDQLLSDTSVNLVQIDGKIEELRDQMKYQERMIRTVIQVLDDNDLIAKSDRPIRPKGDDEAWL